MILFFIIQEGGSLVLDAAACNRVVGTAGNYDDLHGFQYREGADGRTVSSVIKIDSVTISGNTVSVTLSGAPNLTDYPHITYAHDALTNISCGALRDDVPSQLVTNLPAGSDNEGFVLHNWAISFKQQSDNDADGLPDGWEVNNGLNPADASDATTDPDSDGLNNTEEHANGTDPNNSDTDGDGLSDSYEVNTSFTSPVDADSDDDGLNDNDEINTHSTDPLSADSDGDGMSDGWEVQAGLNPLDNNDALDDADADGLTNLEEYENGTDPNLADTDADGLTDFDELNVWSTNPLDPDSDGDGVNDGEDGYPNNPVLTDFPAMDFGADRTADVLVRGPANEIRVGQMDNLALLQTHELGSFAVDRTFSGDIDADGDSDIVFQLSTDDRVWRWTVDSYAKDQGALLASVAGLIVTTLGDIDGDGDDDILVYNEVADNYNKWIMENGNMVSGSYIADWDNEQQILGAGDIDSDGDDDILWRHGTSAAVFAWIMEDGNRESVVNLGTVTLNLDHTAVLDIDGDGDDDILFRGSSTSPSSAQTTIWEMENGARASVNPLGTWFGNMHLETVGDYDGDGDEEAYMRHANGSGDTYIKEFSISAYGNHYSLGNTFVGDTIVAD